MQNQLQLSGTGNNYLELAITIDHHLYQSRTRRDDPLVTPNTFTFVYVRPEGSSSVQNIQE